MIALRTVAALFLVALAAAGCTDIKQVRTVDDLSVHDASHLAPEIACPQVGGPVAGEDLRMIENYGTHWLGYAEFSDEGWGYNASQQIHKIEARLDDSLKDEGANFVVIVFVHGWHHNAHDNDCNVNEFRVMLNVARDRYAPGGAYAKELGAKKVIGIYVGWRGESVDAAGLRYTTVLDRQGSAENVGRGAVRDLFAMLRKHELLANRSHAGRIQTMVMGHSFGGLIAYNAISQAMVNELELSRRDPGPQGCESGREKIGDTSKRTVPPWPDLTVLINPAFEAARFEPVFDVTHPPNPCPYDPGSRPNLLVVTADNDIWTGEVYSAFRSMSTVFAGYDQGNTEAAKRESVANKHAIGFVSRYRTHRLCLGTTPDSRVITVAAYTPQDETQPDLNRPVWVLGAPPEIVDGHDGFLYGCDIKDSGKQTFLLNWLLDLQAYGPKQGTVTDDPGNCGAWPDGKSASVVQCVGR